MCSPIIAVAMVADISEPIIASLASNEQETQFYCYVPLEVSMASTVTAWGKRHNTNLLLLDI
jgi:hypothetical protein